MTIDESSPKSTVPSPGSLVGDLAGFGAAGTKLLSMLENMTGVIARPWISRRDKLANLDGQKLQIDMDTRSTIKHAEADARAAVIAADAQLEIAERAARWIRIEAIRKQENWENIRDQALDRIADMSSADKSNARDIEEDWLQAFINYAGGVSAERLREVWAQVLANQTSNSRSAISFATIDSLRLIEPHFARPLLRSFQLWLVFGQCMDVVEDALEGVETFRLYDRDYHSLCGIGFLELRSAQQTSVTFKEFVLSFHDKRGKRVPVHVETLWPAWRGLELGEVLIPDFYKISMGLESVSEDNCGEFAQQNRQILILNEWARSLGTRCDELRLSVHIGMRTDENRRGRSESRIVTTHRWTGNGWKRLSKIAPEVLSRIPSIVIAAELR